MNFSYSYRSPEFPGKYSDRHLVELLAREEERVKESIPLVASSSLGHPAMRYLQSSVLGDLTAEGYPGSRFHPGCEVFDEIETLAVRRACTAFGSSFANVQPHSGSAANQAALAALASPGDRVLAMELSAGGHLSHGARVSQTANWFSFKHYGVDPDGFLDYGKIEEQALDFRPKVIICGASSYPRAIDFQKFSQIARRVDASLLADISHISGLVATGQHASPVPYADIVTTSTYKQIAGPRGGLILGGTATPEPGKLEKRIEKAVFPGLQGTPSAASIAAKAWAFAYIMSPEFFATASLTITLAKYMAELFREEGFDLLTGGTDNHLILLNISPLGLKGLDVEKALESAGILVNRNAVPNDAQPATNPSGIRVGLNSLAQLRASKADVEMITEIIIMIVKSLRDSSTSSTQELILRSRQRSAQLMKKLWLNASTDKGIENNGSLV
jgi:glycine hydroxymethyltransferase